MGGHILPNFNIYYKAMVIRLCGIAKKKKNRQSDHWDRKKGRK